MYQETLRIQSEIFRVGQPTRNSSSKYCGSVSEEIIEAKLFLLLENPLHVLDIFKWLDVETHILEWYQVY